MLSSLHARLPQLLANSFPGSAALSSQSGPTLKQLLRELYKKVHPDLFHGHPQARAANEKSFQLLQEYISESKEGGSFGGIAGVQYRFEFYLHREAAGDEEPPEADEVEHVALTLPPPGRHGAFQARPGANAADAVPPGAQRALGKLLDACGIANSLKDEDPAASYAGHTWRPVTGERLRDFVPEAAELLLQTEGASFGPREHLGAARTALRISHQVAADFGGAAARLAPGDKVEALQRLGAALDRVPADAAGLHFLLCDSYGTDAAGRVRLPLSDNALLWTAFLLQLDVGQVRAQQAAAAALESLELRVASHCGLAFILPAPPLGPHAPAYRSFLERMAAAAGERGAIFAAHTPWAGLRAAGAGFAADAERCLLTVPVAAEAAQVYTHCQRHGAELEAALRGRREAAAELESIRLRAERRLRLRRLLLDPGLSRARQRAACLRLCQVPQELAGMFEGLSLRVSLANSVPPGASHADIAWDFEL